MGKYRRKPSPVDAYQLVDRDWLVFENGRQEIYTPLEFTSLFEPVVELIDTGIGIFPASQGRVLCKSCAQTYALSEVHDCPGLAAQARLFTTQAG